MCRCHWRSMGLHRMVNQSRRKGRWGCHGARQDPRNSRCRGDSGQKTLGWWRITLSSERRRKQPVCIVYQFATQRNLPTSNGTIRKLLWQHTEQSHVGWRSCPAISLRCRTTLTLPCQPCFGWTIYIFKRFSACFTWDTTTTFRSAFTITYKKYERVKKYKWIGWFKEERLRRLRAFRCSYFMALSRCVCVKKDIICLFRSGCDLKYINTFENAGPNPSTV